MNEVSRGRDISRPLFYQLHTAAAVVMIGAATVGTCIAAIIGCCSAAAAALVAEKIDDDKDEHPGAAVVAKQEVHNVYPPFYGFITYYSDWLNLVNKILFGALDFL